MGAVFGATWNLFYLFYSIMMKDEEFQQPLLSEPEPDVVKPAITKTQSVWRWPILALSCMAMFGSYYCFDNPAALQGSLQKELNLDDFNYNLLYSVYSAPNVILPFFGGLLVNKLSANICIILFLGFLLVGQALFALGASLKSFPLMLVGRVVFGLGGESLCVAESTLLALWFEGKEMAFAMGINLTIARLGSVANDNLSPFLHSVGGLNLALWFGVGLMTLCLFCVFGMVMIDRYATKKYKSSSDDSDLSESGFNMRALFQFNLAFWLITVSCLVVYACVLPFNNISNSFLQEKYGFDKTAAGAIMGIPFIISAVASPFLGGIVDYFGQRATLLTISSIFLGITHSLMAFTSVTPYLTLSILGVSYSIYSSAMWPAVAYVVEKETLGLAYGVTTSVQNTGLLAFPLVVGYIRQKYGNYNAVEIFFTAIAIVGIAVGIALNFVDHYKNNGVLNNTSLRSQKEKKIVDAKLFDEEDVSEASVLTA